MWHRILGVSAVGLSLFSLIGCGGDTPKANEPKATPTSSPTPADSTDKPSEETKVDEAPPQAPPPRTRMPAVAGSGGGQPNASSDAKTDAPTTGRRRAPAVAGSGDDGGAAAAAAAGSDGAAAGEADKDKDKDKDAGGGGSSQTMTIDDDTSGSSTSGSTGPPQQSGPPQQGGPPQGFNNLPPGYGGQGGPPQQGGPPAGFNNLPPGYGGQGGPPQQSGPPPGFNNAPPGYGGQGGPPQQSGPPAGFNNAPPGYGSGPPQQGGGSGSAAMTLDEGGGPGPQQNPGNFGQPQNAPPPVQVEAKSFWDMATNAYAAGQDDDAYKYLLAEFAANRSRFDEMPLSFSAQDKSTTIGVRLGIAVSYTAQEGVSGKPPVIGDPAPVVQRGNQRGSRGPSSFGGNSGPPAMSGPPSGMPGMGGGVPQDARGMLTYYGGDLASALLEELEQKFKREPAYGQLWPRMPAKVMLPAEVANSGQSQVSTGGGGSNRRRGPMMSGSGGEGAPPMSGFGGQPTGPPEGLFPGLTFLGEGNFADLVRKAKNEGLDGLILIDHRASVVRSTGATTSQTTVKFYTCDDGKEKASTAQLGYATVANQVKEGKDPVGKELKSLFTKIDRLVAVGEMPTLTEELAKGRLESILGASKSEPLPFVNEVNFYLQKGWLNEDDAQAFVIKALGESAALELWSGDFEKQKSALGRWLPAR